MTIDDYNNLNDESKGAVLFDADKISEKVDVHNKFQLFYISDFYIETKTSRKNKFKRTVTLYTPNTLPAIYTDEIK